MNLIANGSMINVFYAGAGCRERGKPSVNRKISGTTVLTPALSLGRGNR